METGKQEYLEHKSDQELIYRSGELQITVLGGVKQEGMERLRVTLKIQVVERKFAHLLNNPELAGLGIRHNVDLYNDTQTEKLLRRTAERLEVGISHLTRAVATLTNLLESYRLEQVSRQGKRACSGPAELTEEQQQRCLEFLQSPGLLANSNALIGQSGVVGEPLNRLLMYLIFTSRKMGHPLHVMSLAASGTGKSYLQEKVAALIPQEDKVELTALSENAFYYFEKTELKGKLLLIEDLDGAEGALYPLRELMSKGKLSRTIAHKDSRGQTRSLKLEVEGPVSVAGCTTKEKLYEDNANRSFLLYLDDSSQQDQRIMDYQRRQAAGLVDYQQERFSCQLLQDCQRLLRPISVRNPYALQLELPASVFKPRRSNAHYLGLIAAVSFYHQYQRKQHTDANTGEVYIETTLEDIAAAHELMKDTLLAKSDELNRATRNYLEQVRGWLKDKDRTSFSTREIRAAFRIHPSNQKRYMLQLARFGYIRRIGRKRYGSTPLGQGQGDQIELTSLAWEQDLKSSIDQLLAGILNKLQSGVTDPVTQEFPHCSASKVKKSSKVVQKQNEPVPVKPGKGKEEKSKGSAKNLSAPEAVFSHPPESEKRSSKPSPTGQV